MKVLIVSDTHKKDENLRAAIWKEKPFDMLIHLGDNEGSEGYFDYWVDDPRCAIVTVRGNNDFFSSSPAERMIYIGKYRAFLTHGHRYGVSMTTEHLREEARSRGADIAMFGHSHRPHLARPDGMIVLNPGSLSYPRQGDRRCTYLVMTLDAAGEARFRQGTVDAKDLMAMDAEV